MSINKILFEEILAFSGLDYTNASLKLLYLVINVPKIRLTRNKVADLCTIFTLRHCF